ncbi:MAG TPA: cupredoxin domain-containing protein [Stellaceae bacterium]|nr:cupredoxin domain-containing protein [Stellaceae bacterium]
MASRRNLLLGSILALCVAAPAPGRRAGAADADTPQAERVMVVLSEFHFTPDHLRFRRGVLYRLHLENRGKELHEFTAPAFFRAVEIKDRSALTPEGTEIVLQPHESKEIEFVAQLPGTYPLTCADHDFEGMTGEIVIE